MFMSVPKLIWHFKAWPTHTYTLYIARTDELHANALAELFHSWGRDQMWLTCYINKIPCHFHSPRNKPLYSPFFILTNAISLFTRCVCWYVHTCTMECPFFTIVQVLILSIVPTFGGLFSLPLKVSSAIIINASQQHKCLIDVMNVSKICKT